MNTEVVFSIIAITAAALLFAASALIATHEAMAATTPSVVNPLGTIPETTTTGTVCLVIPGGGYGYGGFGHGFHHH